MHTITVYAQTEELILIIMDNDVTRTRESTFKVFVYLPRIIINNFKLILYNVHFIICISSGRYIIYNN